MNVIVKEQSVDVKRAALLLNMSEKSVQCGLIAGVLPIGAAWHNVGSTAYKYHISAQKLADYLGLTKEEVVYANLIKGKEVEEVAV